MAGNFPLKTLVELAQQRSDSAARSLGALNAQGEETEKRLQLLLRYREDYQTQFRESVRSGMPSAGWRNFHEFLAKLDAAIALQRELVAQAKLRTLVGQREWQAQQCRLKSFNTLSARHLGAESSRAAKAEQREQDEHALKSFGRERE